eukprot:scaffold7205_cov523-Prasinococcus_capsulatus_cf.AAC.8
MSSSDPNSKIDLLDSAKRVRDKIKKAFCEPGNIENNGLLAFVKNVYFPIMSHKGLQDFNIARDEKWGGPITYTSYQDMEDDFVSEKLSPQDLKLGVTDAINMLLDPIRKKFEDPELIKLTNEAYPDEAPTSGKVRKRVLPSRWASPAACVDVQKPAAEAARDADYSRAKIVCGRIVEIQRHPEAESLFLEKIDVGEAEPRVVVSGLVKYFQMEELEGRMVALVTNLKPAKLKGILSYGMVLAAASADGNTVELVDPPQVCRVRVAWLHGNNAEATPRSLWRTDWDTCPARDANVVNPSR